MATCPWLSHFRRPINRPRPRDSLPPSPESTPPPPGGRRAGQDGTGSLTSTAGHISGDPRLAATTLGSVLFLGLIFQFREPGRMELPPRGDADAAEGWEFNPLRVKEPRSDAVIEGWRPDASPADPMHQRHSAWCSGRIHRTISLLLSSVRVYLDLHVSPVSGTNPCSLEVIRKSRYILTSERRRYSWSSLKPRSSLGGPIRLRD